MVQRLRVVRTVSALRRAIANYRRAGETVALVPTMGALHAGHLSLIKMARSKADRVVVSIFVNPAQFAPGEDFATYPRTWAKDLAVLDKAKANLIWAPANETMYPSGFATRIAPEGPAAAGLEDAVRPHFFGGVATVVAKLFLQSLPDFAVFGEKDYQQLKVVEQMVRDLDMPIRIIGAPTLRDPDGLALSSRNAYLKTDQRAAAPLLYQVLRNAAREIREGKRLASILSSSRKRLNDAGFAIDYFEARDAETLQPVHRSERGRIRLLAAVKLGRTRLIDNVGV
jgi:pantoate--beta-alanine ligase